MYTFAATLLLGLALFKMVDVLEELVPDLTKLHGAVTLGLAIATAFVIDFSLFEGFEVALREDWMGTLFTGAAIAGATTVWRSAFHWVGSSGGEEPDVRHRHSRMVNRAA
jgi:hypothetical protein